ncbi:MAG TPA: transposase [Candidatus Nitrosocosmicus sp.]|nr:transposase [Candidatus Nitrosocosmicus sp.]
MRRNTILSTGEIYHVYNKTIGKEFALCSDHHNKHFLSTLQYYRLPQRIKFSRYRSLPQEIQDDYDRSINDEKPLVEIYSWALMPNHYHLLLKQNTDEGLKNFIATIQNSFAKYYNTIENRTGSLFQHKFKAKHIENNEQFIHISRYIHLNPVTSGIITFDQLIDYPWTSFALYNQHNTNNGFVAKDLILNHFKTSERYIQFVKNQIEYQQKLHSIKKLLID